MLAIISIELTNVSDESASRFAEEMASFGWEKHPDMADVFTAEFVDSASDDGVIETACCELRLCLGVTDAQRWQASVATARRTSDAAELTWE